MLSRVANSLFWMARYMERAENTARLIDVNIHMMLDIGRCLADVGSSEPYWNPIIRMNSSFESFRANHPRTTREAAIDWLTFGAANSNSILSCVARARENARAMRGSISSEMWEHVNTTYLALRGTGSAEVWREGPHTYFQRIKLASQLFQGLVESTIPRDEGWRWIELGLYLERADATSRLVDVKYHILLPSVADVGGPIDSVQWIAVLKSCSAYEAFQQRYVARITPARVAEFLVLDRSFPRSVRFCFDQIYWALRCISTDHGALGELSPEIVASNVRRMLGETTMSGIIQFGLHEYMMQLQSYCAETTDKITSTYFQGALRHAA